MITTSSSLGKYDCITNDRVLIEVLNVGANLVAGLNLKTEKYVTIPRSAIDNPDSPWRCVFRYQPDRVQE